MYIKKKNYYNFLAFNFIIFARYFLIIQFNYIFATFSCDLLLFYI